MCYVCVFSVSYWICFWYVSCFAIVLFLLCFLLAFRLCKKKHYFPCKSSVFESSWSEGSFFLSCVVSSLNNEGVLLYVCVVCFLSVTRLSGGFLVCILWSCFCFVVLFSMLFFGGAFFIPLKGKNRTQQKTQKTEMQKKGTLFCSWRSCVHT